MEPNKGYFKKGLLEAYLEKQKQTKEEIYTVKCKNCNTTWKESFLEYNKPVFGYRREYDYCEKCKGTI